MRILYFGDIVGKPGRRAVISALPQLREEFSPDFVFGNVENLAHGLGITPESIQELLNAGFDGMTSGNHIYDKEPGFACLKDPSIPLVRPLNYEKDGMGRGFVEISFQSRKLLVVNLMGTVFMHEEYANPFVLLDELLQKYKDERLAGIILDFHAEATSEKRAMGFFADGRVSAVVGTHTHVQTNDAQILPGGTAYISDMGMSGVRDSIIGASKVGLIDNYVKGEKFRYRIAEDGTCDISFVIIDIDAETQKATSITNFVREVTA